MRNVACTLAVLVCGAAGLLLHGQTPAASPTAAGSGTSCERLTQLTIPGVAIVSAQPVPAGQIEPEPGRAFEVPAFCRVRAVATPSADSHINIEVWLPATDAWNTRFLGVGNGGFSGAIGYPAMASAVGRGYATAGTDTGHAGDQMEFGQGHPERIVDWAYRAIHITAEVGKLVARNHYGRFPARSYFNGCSTGGQQALSEAQRFPADYDGIVAGAPANNRIRLILGFLWGWNAAHREDGTAIITQRDLELVTRGSMDACDGADGLKDGIISDPRACRFAPASLRCSGDRKDSCLGSEQIEAFQKIYGGARTARTGEQLYPGWMRGSEAGWQQYLTSPKEPVRVGLFRYFVFHNPDWNPRTFDWDRDVVYIESQVPHLSAMSLDYTAFRKRGGKLLIYTGLADPVVPAEEVMSYYEKVAMAAGGFAEIQKFSRFFAVPGMGHCGGGDAPNTFDAQAAIEGWVEKELPPAQLLATQNASGKVVRTRPLCPYPQVARYRGSGPTEDASSFTCAAR